MVFLVRLLLHRTTCGSPEGMLPYRLQSVDRAPGAHDVLYVLSCSYHGKSAEHAHTKKRIVSYAAAYAMALRQAVCISLQYTSRPAFSSALIHQRSGSKLQDLIHSHINLLSFSQHNHSILNYFRIYFIDNEFKKSIVYKFKI
jgi:hypothetical protein